MQDIWDEKQISPMLIGAESGPFDDDSCLFELKFDGVRGLAYLDSQTCELRNKRNIRVSSIYPELAGINQQVNRRCILVLYPSKNTSIQSSGNLVYFMKKQ